MNPAIERTYQEIGQAALGLTDGEGGKVLVYAEIDDGVISADLFYATGEAVRFRFCPKPMQDLIYAFWERWQAEPGNRQWRTMAYVIDHGKFAIDLRYPDQVNPDEDVSDRRPLVVRQHFGDMKVDYSQPK